MEKKNYEEYFWGRKEGIRYIAEGMCLVILFNLLFYQNLLIGGLAIVPIEVLYLRYRRKGLITKQKRELNFQFKDALSSLSVALAAGYSAENAVSICRKDLERLYGTEKNLYKEFRYIEKQMALSVPLEDLFSDFARRSGLEDIENFAAVFVCAKRNGGDMEKIIRKTASMLGDKIDVKKEIDATLSAKKSEQMIMSLMPSGIILYMQLTSPGFLSVLYGNAFGVTAMTLCLIIYFFAYWMGRRIVDIQI